METYLGVKLVKGNAMTRGEYNDYRGWKIPENENPADEGSLVVYSDGYESWCPKIQFDRNNLHLQCENSITQSDVIDFVVETDIQTLGSKTTLVRVILRNGFEIVETSSCVDPANYDENMGANICMDKIYSKIWELLGFLLQCGMNGFTESEDTYSGKTKNDNLDNNPGPKVDDVELLACGCSDGCKGKDDSKDCSCAMSSPAFPRVLGTGTRRFTEAVAHDEPMDNGANHEYSVNSVEDSSVFATIKFQEGPIGETGINGIHNEDLLAIVVDRLVGFQTGPYLCEDNENAISAIKTALVFLNGRTADRNERGVEGTSQL